MNDLTERWELRKVSKRMRRTLLRIADKVARNLGAPVDAILEPLDAPVEASLELRVLAHRIACYLGLFLTSAKPSAVGAMFGNIKGQSVQKQARLLRKDIRGDRLIREIVHSIINQHLDERIAEREARQPNTVYCADSGAREEASR